MIYNERVWLVPGTVSWHTHPLLPHEDTKEDGNMHRMSVAERKEGPGIKMSDDTFLKLCLILIALLAILLTSLPKIV